MNLIEAEVWMVVSEDGSYEVGCSEEDAVARFEENVGSLSDAGSTRRVKVVLNVPTPQAVVLTGTVPAEGEAELEVA